LTKGTSTHNAWFHSDIEISVFEYSSIIGFEDFINRTQFCMTNTLKSAQRTMARHRSSFVGLVHSSADDFVGMDKDAADRSLAGFERRSCLQLATDGIKTTITSASRKYCRCLAGV
jgi:hypothetical protein